MTNLQNLPVGATLTTTNADGSVVHETVVSRTEYDLRANALWLTAVVGIGLLLALAFKMARRKP